MVGTAGRNERRSGCLLSAPRHRNMWMWKELTQTIVNEYIKKIIVYAPDKSSGKRKQKVKIFFNFVDDVDIPLFPSLSSRKQPMNTEKRRDLRVTPFSATK